LLPVGYQVPTPAPCCWQLIDTRSVNTKQCVVSTVMTCLSIGFKLHYFFCFYIHTTRKKSIFHSILLLYNILYKSNSYHEARHPILHSCSISCSFCSGSQGYHYNCS
jgi:hypothetical protein